MKKKSFPENRVEEANKLKRDLGQDEFHELPESVRDVWEILRWPVYRYHYIDWGHCFMFDARQALKEGIKDRYVEIVMGAVELRLRVAGWEGDGAVTIMWLPPFVVGNDWGAGQVVFHVKQSNNGTSFMVTKEPLNFPGLETVR